MKEEDDLTTDRKVRSIVEDEVIIDLWKLKTGTDLNLFKFVTLIMLS